MSDIVERLRELFYPDQIEWEAADAIEQLRADLAAERAEVERLRDELAAERALAERVGVHFDSTLREVKRLQGLCDEWADWANTIPKGGPS